MRKLPPFLQALIAGGLAALLTSVLIWLLTVTDLLALLGVPVAAPGNPTSWIAWRIVWGCIFALLFFVPVLPQFGQVLRGLLVSLVPMAKLFLWDYPHGGEGWFGMNLGVLLPISAVVIWVLWGFIAGWLLEAWDFARFMEGDEMPPDPAA